MEKFSQKFQIYKNGFTLAEVLITLVIVGVVAALTIPTVINTYVESSTVGKVKKGLSILGQAKRLAEAQNGSIIGWDFEGSDNAQDSNKFWRYLKPHLSVVKECDYGSNPADCSVSTLKGLSTSNNYAFWGYYKFILSDGSVMWFRISGPKCSSTVQNVDNVCAIFFYDINGDKKPNTIGKDVFSYNMNIDGVYPSAGSCLGGDGWGCTAHIIKYGNMNYLH